MMNINEFAKRHIDTEKELEAVSNLQRTTLVYYKIYLFLNKTLNPEFSLLLNILKEENQFDYTEVSDVIPHHRYMKLVKYLITEDFCTKIQEIGKPTIYNITDKCKDFLKIKIVNNFLEEVYK